MLDITVGILSYNRPLFLAEALNSVLNQSCKPSRVVVYDNGSNPDLMAGLVGRLPSGVEWNGVRENQIGVSSLRRVIQNCSTEYFMLLHDDDRLHPDFLRLQYECLKDNPHLSALSCNGLMMNQFGDNLYKALMPIGTLNEIEFYRTPHQIAMKYAKGQCIPMSPAIYKTYQISKIELNDNYGKVTDAVNFCKLVEYGPVGYHTFPLYDCRVHSMQDSSSIPYATMNELEQYFWTPKFASDYELVEIRRVLLRQHSLRNIKEIFRQLHRGDFSAAFTLFLDKRLRLSSLLGGVGAAFRRRLDSSRDYK